jgi:hypothetical protein
VVFKWNIFNATDEEEVMGKGMTMGRRNKMDRYGEIGAREWLNIKKRQGGRGKLMTI